MDKHQKRNSLGQAIYWFSFTMVCLKYIFDSSSVLIIPDFADNLLILLALAGLFSKILIQTYTFKGLAVTFLLISLVSFVCIRGSNNTFLITFLCVMGLQNVDLKKIIKFSAYLKIIVIVVHLIWYIIVYNTNPGAIQFVYRDGVQRHYFFMGHANGFTFLLTSTMLELIYVYYHKVHFGHILLMWVTSFVFYRFTDSNSGVILSTLVGVLTLLEKHGKRTFAYFIGPLTKYAHGVFSVLFPFLVVIYTRLSGSALMVWEIVNKFFSGRLIYGAYAYDTYGFTILGRTINFPSKIYWRGNWFDNMVYFDNYYVGQFVLFGIILLVLVSLGFAIYSPKMDNAEKIVALFFIFYGIMELYVVNVFFCSSLLLIGKYYYLGLEPQPQKSPKTILEPSANAPPLPLWKQ